MLANFTKPIDRESRQDADIVVRSPHSLNTYLYMSSLQKVFIGFVALEHLFILYMEMFKWPSLGKKVFREAFPETLFEQTTVMAANQGLYNGFLAAGLIWALLIKNKEWRFNITVFFLTCVIIAGVYGSCTIAGKVFFTQALPALLALTLVLLNHLKSTCK